MKGKLKSEQLEAVISEVRPYLAEYLSSQIPGFKRGHNFPCPHPDHKDRTPSCGIVPQNPELFHCFGCNSVGDVFHAAHYLEGKPLSGWAFWADNVFPLAEMFGIAVPKVELTPEEEEELRVWKAYRDASNYLTAQKSEDLSVLVQERLAFYGWDERTRRDLRIGSVPSFSQYLRYLIQDCGYSRDWLHKIDLDNEKIFHPGALIFTISDEHGSPCGFSARQLQWDGLQEQFNAWLAAENPSEEEIRAAKQQLPQKFINTSSRCPIYRKGSLLYGLHFAKRHLATGPLWIVEGNTDVATPYDQGMRNLVGLNGTGFTEKHLQLLLDLGAKHLVFCLDPDAAGEKAVDRSIRLIEEKCSNQVGLKVEVMLLPSSPDGRKLDPDELTRTQGINAFQDLDRIDLFSWNMRQALQKGEDADQLYERTIGLVVSESEIPKRYRKAQALAAATGFPVEVVWQDVEARTSREDFVLEQQKVVLANELGRQLMRNPGQIEQIIFGAQGQVERISKQKNGHDQLALLQYFDSICEKADANLDEMGFATGFPLFDQWVGGIPKSEAFITVPGKPNHGKSTWMVNLAWKLLQNIDDLIVFIHTTDDSLSKYLTRIYGSMLRVPSQMFQSSGYHLEKNTLIYPNSCQQGIPFSERLTMVRSWVRQMMQDGRLILNDSMLLPKTIASLDWKLREIRKQYPTTPIFTILDNFHKYELPLGKDPNRAEREMSDHIKDMTTRYATTIMSTMEMPKGALQPGERPRSGTGIKGNAGISYDASINIGFYNDLRDLRDEAVLYQNVRDLRTGVVTRLPVVELLFDKSKEGTGFDGEIYFQLEPKSGQLQELDEEDQSLFRQLSRQQQQEMKERGKKRGKDDRNSSDSHHFITRPVIDARPTPIRSALQSANQNSEVF